MAEESAIIGGRQLAEFLRQLPLKVERNIMRAAMRAGAAVIRDEARQLVPVDMGALRKSIRVSTGSKRGQVKAIVKAGSYKAFYAHMVEYGTKRHFIKVNDGERPINYRLTRKRGRLVYQSMRTINRNSLKIGNTFVGPVVEHPGAKESPFMRPALDNAGDRAIQAVVAVIRERLTQEGINAPAPGSDE